MEKYLPDEVTEIVSGGARGVDTSAREYALSHGIKRTEFLPEYQKYGRSAPLKRNITIIENADLVLAFWDGVSRGTKFVIDNCNDCLISGPVFGKRGFIKPFLGKDMDHPHGDPAVNGKEGRLQIQAAFLVWKSVIKT